MKYTILKVSIFYSICLFSTIFSTPSDQNFVTQLKNLRFWHEDTPLKLHLGCGESYLPGYINIDFPSQDHTVQTNAVADLFTDIVKLKLPDSSVDEIRLHHVFEHFDRQVSLALLCNWHQALKEGGILYLETPDFDRSARLMLLDSTLSYQEKQVILRHIFGSHEAHWAIHCDGWYEEKYMHVLSQLGFQNIKIEHSRYLNLCNITVTAVKTKNLDRDQLLRASKEILRESMVADCETKMYEVWCEQLEKTCQ